MVDMGKVYVTLANLTEEERDILCRFMQAGLQAMGNGDFRATIFGTLTPPGGDPPDAERDEDTGFLHCRVEADYVEPIFAKLFPGVPIYQQRPEFQ